MDHNPKTPPSDAYEINLLDVAIVLAKHKKLLIVLPLVTALIAAIQSLFTPNTYTADTSFMAPRQSSSVSSMLSSLSSLGSISGLLGGGASGVLSGANDIYVATLNSRTIQDRMIKRFNLFTSYQTKSWESARKSLSGQTDIKTGKDGLIHIQITDSDPKHAAQLANGYVDELLQSNNQLALSGAAQRRLFAEGEFLKAKNTLSEAESSVKNLQEQTGLITVGPQVAMLQTMINTTQRQLVDMSLTTTSNNPEYIKTRQKLSNLEAEIGKAQGSKGVVSKAPERILDFAHKTRDLKYAEAIYQMALQQLTLEKLDEVNAGSSIQIIDRAVPPEQKTGPQRSRTVLIATLAALFVAVILAFAKEALDRSKQNPESTTQYQTIRKLLSDWK